MPRTRLRLACFVSVRAFEAIKFHVPSYFNVCVYESPVTANFVFCPSAAQRITALAREIPREQTVNRADSDSKVFGEAPRLATFRSGRRSSDIFAAPRRFCCCAQALLTTIVRPACNGLHANATQSHASGRRTTTRPCAAVWLLHAPPPDPSAHQSSSAGRSRRAMPARRESRAHMTFNLAICGRLLHGAGFGYSEDPARDVRARTQGRP
jgi:hypothetical protein